ncbi:hypothetical protein [Rathayibacter sp. AY2B5]|uniref:hypothetical protein n=1 Tax=Rathayibacter sp. AY2B5 TaxID=2080570 RepID=UPI000CE79E91|nr:hypothetical protein [Rathayibacter sp. AY2B5]PPG37162.1 hypothetical protein C5C30_14215 [Rathayibacter sp. AY2B5]
MEGTFTDGIEKSDESADDALDLAGIPITDVPEPIEPPISVDDPSGTILREWQAIQVLLTRLLTENADVGKTLPSSATRNGGSVLKLLQHRRLIEPNTFLSANGLLELRNRVAHGEYTPSGAEAFAYARTAEKLRGYLDYRLDHDRAHGRGMDE